MKKLSGRIILTYNTVLRLLKFAWCWYQKGRSKFSPLTNRKIVDIRKHINRISVFKRLCILLLDFLIKYQKESIIKSCVTSYCLVSA